MKFIGILYLVEDIFVQQIYMVRINGRTYWLF